ncbi:hypothetical protein I317_05791 [Kwoniella heveanensis CBS 569]|nr:hypothetical protein I317_05791 [Kwoniella heveanensis CBS 569]
MSKPAASLNAAAKAAFKSASAPALASGSARPRTYTAGQASRMPKHAQPSYLLLHDIPRTVLPSDIVRALKDSGAVDASFTASSLTPPPPSLPKAPSMTRTWHLTLPSYAHANEVHNLLNAQPLFSSTSSSSSSSSFTRNLPSGPRTSGSFASDGTLILKHHAQFIDSPSSSWIADLIRRSIEERDPKERERDAATERGFTAEWVMQRGYSGRRVVIKGLPGGVKAEQVRKLGKDCGVLDGREGVKRLPPSRYSLVSTYCLTTESVSDAYRLARKLHMRWYKSIVHGEKYLMFAEVVY